MMGWHDALSVLVMVVGALVALLLLVVSAPYGRHGRAGWGPVIPARLGWIVMESPAVVWFAIVYLWGGRSLSVVPLVLFSLWQLHYVHRGWIFPFRVRASGKTMPVSVVAMAFVFQTVNAGLNAWWIGALGTYEVSWLLDVRFLSGLGLFAAGMVINLHSDTILLGLRKGEDGSYRIPHGGLFRWVSCPNYLGELMEWVGWACMTWSLSGLAFAVFTACNLVPRARTHHRWYRAEFPDYPRERRALIPFLF